MGKFHPLHAGHLFLIDTARDASERVTVLIGERPEERITGELRERWIGELRPDVDLIRITDTLPEDPAHPDYWSIWVDSIRENAPDDIDVIFSSEDYGEVLAGMLSIANVCVDRERVTVPITGTAVRGDPFANWSYLSEPVRAYYAKRVALVGPESTGKSTLSKLLAAHYATACVEEYGREYTDHCEMSQFSPEDILRIAEGQVAREDQAARQANRVLICDTELITTSIWSEIYHGSVPEWVAEESRRRHYDLFLLLDIDIPWVDDGTREFPHLRQWHFERIKEELESQGRPYRVISGEFNTRLRTAIQAVDEFCLRCG